MANTFPLVFFARGENAGGKIISTDDFESDDILGISVWRWSENPECVIEVYADGDVTHKLMAAAFVNGSDEINSDLTKLLDGFETQIEDDEWFDVWDAVTALQEVGATDGFLLGEHAASIAGFEIATDDDYDE